MRLHWLLPGIKGIPVLMYHRVWPGQRDGLTLPPEDLREQWSYLRDAGYQCLTLPDALAIMRGENPAPPKAFLLTFDDGYRNNLDHVLPLLEEFSWEATVFIIAGTLDGSYTLNESDAIDRKMSATELKKLTDSGHIRLGLHGYQHENFSEHTIEALTDVLRKSCETFEQSGLPYEKVLAYPYGARPKDWKEAMSLKAWMDDYGIGAAFRIGNKPQRTPASDMYELMRIDVRGEDSLEDFKIKLRKGKLKPF